MLSQPAGARRPCSEVYIDEWRIACRHAGCTLTGSVRQDQRRVVALERVVEALAGKGGVPRLRTHGSRQKVRCSLCDPWGPTQRGRRHGMIMAMLQPKSSCHAGVHVHLVHNACGWTDMPCARHVPCCQHCPAHGPGGGPVSQQRSPPLRTVAAPPPQTCCCPGRRWHWRRRCLQAPLPRHAPATRGTRLCAAACAARGWRSQRQLPPLRPLAAAPRRRRCRLRAGPCVAVRRCSTHIKAEAEPAVHRARVSRTCAAP